MVGDGYLLHGNRVLHCVVVQVQESIMRWSDEKKLRDEIDKLPTQMEKVYATLGLYLEKAGYRVPPGYELVMAGQAIEKFGYWHDYAVSLEKQLKELKATTRKDDELRAAIVAAAKRLSA